ncbi:UDP-N-acetyl-D-mannosamine dehydrogenase [Achromobacter piechaudii]|uniref:UDP-N-acetyl-D-mannosamine dehydrogenase n=1 Tax=Achromobacter piechaudii TaxID=72556 RepID=A0ABM8KVE9_9BURK|nr:UDP-N-acetyl-D-mannosamine dehydrogenase [Achromobacter piechaudii]CAB3687284.1 UDP-N-acetyl-D-mannosamine dehydrogenase [Achromobacter piechaudii]CAB3865562.1 UDP-N-acetyl-D-mannosamine dehydrogenase [Achromobacter piechaudii]CAB3948947.1 UDP-N-acetyl-D-mannosamine dehydrogenase [Achromobacter piechaudii]
MFNTIEIIGLGYIGLPTATLFASRKKTVIGVDVNPHAVNTINQGRIHIIEPELDMLVHAAVTAGYLRATREPERADAFLIAVPTPFKEGHKPDVSYIEAAARSIAPVLEKGNLVILESTSPVGTTAKLAEWLSQMRPDLSFPQQEGELADVQVAYCPERVLPGRVVHELVSNDRVIGGMTNTATHMAVELYRIFVEAELIPTDARTAEMCKLTENSFRDVNIAFANELSVVCDRLGIDVWELIELANRHPRVNILQPSAGVGGHCISVDPWFIVDSTPEDARIIKMARDVNDQKPEWVVSKIKTAVDAILEQKPGIAKADIKIACLGLAFKPDIDDLRESPAMGITEQTSRLGCEVLVVEPNIDELPEQLAESNVSLVTLKAALETADIVCVLVKHRPFIDEINDISHHENVIDVVGLLHLPAASTYR